MVDDILLRVDSLARKYGFSFKYCLEVLERIREYNCMRNCDVDTLLLELDVELALESFEQELISITYKVNKK